MDVFDIIGPVMIGPSSSHTAGAVRIGLIARELLGSQPCRAVISLSGSFARTYRGHGTDKAILAGLLGFQTDDERIRLSRQLAREAGMDYDFRIADLPGAHPNTAVLELWDAAGQMMTVRGASVGGGAILIESINGLAVFFSGEYNTLIVIHKDTPGVVAAVTNLLVGQQINIANMKVFRFTRGGESVMMIETDQVVSPELNNIIGGVAGVRSSSQIMPIRK